ncbi:MAG TPA: hypothetical protein VMO78_13455 [Rhizomicrobium sp.]|nr:hypothetical protein [Rhizomicrobium sp.]
MKHSHIALAIMLATGPNMLPVAPALASGLTWAETQSLPDPSLANGPVFKPSVATAGVAAVSAKADGPLTDCSRRNPCAMPSPARDHVVVVKSASPKLPSADVKDARESKVPGV